MLSSRLNGMLGIDAPILGFNRSPQVVVEVSRAGGLGVLAVTPYTPEQLDAQLTWIEERLEGRPYGVDLLLPQKSLHGDPDDYIRSLRAQIPQEHLRFVHDLMVRYEIPDAESATGGADRWASSLSGAGVEGLVEVALTHNISLIASALGAPPGWMVDQAKGSGVTVAALVGAPHHARRQLDLGVDLLVAQGTEAGGHTGTISSMVLTPEIVEIAGDVPVLCAGGVASGRQMAAALALGASGVWCGSVWLSSLEDITPNVIKQKFLSATSSDTLRSPTRTGKPARQLRSSWHDEWDKPGSPAPLPMPLQPLLVRDVWDRIDAAAERGVPGAVKLASWHVGQVVGDFHGLRPTAEITTEIIRDCEQTLRELARLVG